MRSIRSRLLGWLFCGVAAGSGAAGFDIIDRALNEAGKLFNYGQCALVLPPQPNQAANLAKRWVPVKQGITGEHIPIGIGDTTGGPIFCSSHDATLPRDPAGFDTIGHADPHWRTDGLEPANRCVRVAQPTSAREEPMPRLAVRAVSPLVLFLTVAIAPVILVLRAMARDLAPRSALPPRFGARKVGS